MASAAIEVVDDDINEGNADEPSSMNFHEVEPVHEDRVQLEDEHLPEDLASLWNHFKVVSADKTKIECLIKQCGVLSFSPPGFSPNKLLLHLQTKHKQFYETTVKKKLLKRSAKKINGVNLASEKWIDRDIFSSNFTFDKSKLDLDKLKTINVSFNGYRLHVPVFLVDAFDLLCLNVKTEGLFQSRGNRQRVKYMRYVFFGEFGIPEYCTLYDVCDLVTYFFRHLSEPILPPDLEKQFIDLRRNNSSTVLNNLKACLKELSPSKRDTIIYLAVKLKYIVSFGNVNKATTQKVAQYFAKSLFRRKTKESDNDEMDLRVKSIVSLIDFIGFILSEKNSILFKKPVDIVLPSSTSQAAPCPSARQKQTATLITVSPINADEEVDVKPIINFDRKTSKKKKQVVTIEDNDNADENEPEIPQPERSQTNLSTVSKGLEHFPPYVSMASTEIVNNDAADQCAVTDDHPESGNLLEGRTDDEIPMGENSLSNSQLFVCSYCLESFKSALLHSYHVRQKHSKQFLGKKSRIRKKKVDETRKITMKKIKAAKLPKKIARSKDFKLKVKLKQKEDSNVIANATEIGESCDKVYSKTNENEETPVGDTEELSSVVGESSISEKNVDLNLESHTSINLNTDTHLVEET